MRRVSTCNIYIILDCILNVNRGTGFYSSSSSQGLTQRLNLCNLLFFLFLFKLLLLKQLQMSFRQFSTPKTQPTSQCLAHITVFSFSCIVVVEIQRMKQANLRFIRINTFLKIHSVTESYNFIQVLKPGFYVCTRSRTIKINLCNVCLFSCVD